MPLVEVPLVVDRSEPIPSAVREFVQEANRRIDAFQQESRVPGFVPSHLEQAYRVLRAVAADHARPGALFCEWGSGFGAIACLAALLGFDAVGIEIEAVLVDEAERLARDFNVPVEFLRGSFIPEGSTVVAEVDPGDGFAWLTPEEASPGALPFDPDDFDIIFAYPWPSEEDVTQVLFERHARPGALLVSYHGGETFRLRRKIARGKREARARR